MYRTLFIVTVDGPFDGPNGGLVTVQYNDGPFGAPINLTIGGQSVYQMVVKLVCCLEGQFKH